MKNVKCFVDGVNGNTLTYQLGTDAVYEVLVLDRSGHPLSTDENSTLQVEFYSGVGRDSTLVATLLGEFTTVDGRGSFTLTDTDSYFTSGTTYYLYVTVIRGLDEDGYGYGSGDGYGPTSDVSTGLTPSVLVVG